MIQYDIADIKSIFERTNASHVSFTIRSWLMAPDASLNHNPNCAKCHPSTGLWFVNGHQFQNWLKESNSFLWLNSFAGCGKSVLCSTTIQYSFQHMRQKGGAVGIAFFYFSFSDDQKQDDNGMLRTLLQQLSAQLVPDGDRDLKQLYELYYSGSPSVNVLLDSLHRLLRRFSDVYILTDALDESPRYSKREGVLKTIEAIRGWSIPSLHLLVTSRNELDIRESLNPLLDQNVSLRSSEVDGDIESFVSYQLKIEQKLQKWKARHTDIKEKLTAGAQGV